MSEKLWETPDSWTWTTISELGAIASGATPSTSDERNFDGSIPWITPADLSGYTAKYISEGRKSISQRGLDSCSAVMMPAGTVLFSSRAPVGYVAIAANPVSTNQGFKSLTPAEGVSSEYLYYYLKGSKALAESFASGTTFLEISGKQFARLPVPLAPLAEQGRIVEKVEELLSGVDAGVAELEATRQRLRRYRQAVLKAAVEGALTAEWRERHRGEVEPAQALLARVLEERRARWETEQLTRYEAQGKKPPKNWREPYPEPKEPRTEELATLPEGWAWGTAEQVSDETSITYGVIKLGDPVEGGVPTLRSSNVRHLRIDQTGIKRISPELSQEYKRTVLKGGEVVLTVRGTLGGVAAVPNGLAGYNVSREVAVLGPLPGVRPEYLAACIGSKPIQSWLLARARGVAYTGINIATLKELPVPIPPLVEQTAIIEEVERRMSVVDAIAAEVEAALARAGHLRQSVLRRAFEGRLVPQEPADEPASALLGRIREEKRGGGANRKRRPRQPEQVEFEFKVFTR